MNRMIGATIKAETALARRRNGLLSVPTFSCRGSNSESLDPHLRCSALMSVPDVFAKSSSPENLGGRRSPKAAFRRVSSGLDEVYGPNPRKGHLEAKQEETRR